MLYAGNRNNGIEIPEHGSGSKLFFSLVNKIRKEWMKMKTK
jgi:hypothetical protein